MLAPHAQRLMASLSYCTVCAVTLVVVWIGAVDAVQAQRQAVPVPAGPPAAGEAIEAYPHPHMLEVLGGGSRELGRNVGADAAQIAKWVQDLDSNSFAARKAATAELAEVGERMVPVLLEAMRDRDSLEQRTRGFQLLQDMATSELIDAEAAAFDGLRELGYHTEPILNSRAKKSLARVEKTYQGRALKRLEARGAILSPEYAFGQAQRINIMPNGGRFIPGPSVQPGSYLLFDENWKGNAADLEMLRFVPRIYRIHLQGKNIGNEFPAAIKHCKSLRVLQIRKTSITDEGIAHIENLPELGYLDVRYTKITNKSLPALGSLKIAKRITLYGTDIPPESAVTLTAALPAATLVDIRQGGFLGVGERMDVRGTPLPGCRISRPEPNSAAERAGLIQDDLVLKYGDEKVSSFTELRELIGVNAPGDEIEMTIQRGKSTLVKKVTLGEWPENR